MGSLKVRFSQSSERFGGLNYALRVEVVSSEGMPKKIFVFHQMPVGIEGNTFAEFDHVATPVDFQEIPEDAASEIVPWYRTDKCTVWFRSISDLRMAKQMFVDDIFELQRSFGVLTSYEDFSDNTTLEFSDGGVQEVADVHADGQKPLMSVAKLIAVSSVLILGSHSSLGSSVQSSDLNTLDLETNPRVVTNVSLEGLATSDDIKYAISANNQDFVEAVKNTPISFPSDIEVGDLAEYGTIGALLIAMTASIAWLKSKASATDSAIEGKASSADLPYRLVEPGKWEFSGTPPGYYVSTEPEIVGTSDGYRWFITITDDNVSVDFGAAGEASQADLELVFSASGYSDITATRPSLPGHLCDRAVNSVSASGATTLILPELTENGKSRDFLVYVTATNSSDLEFVANGHEQTSFLTEDGTFPEPDSDGLWSYSFTEMAQGVFAVSLINLVMVDEGSSSSSPDGV